MRVLIKLPKEVEYFFEMNGFKCDGYLNFDRFIKKVDGDTFELVDYEDLPKQVKDMYDLSHTSKIIAND